MVYTARPCVSERSTVEYPNISASGTLAPITWASPRCVMPPILPRRLLRSPITSPMYSAGVTTSTSMIGSRSPPPPPLPPPLPHPPLPVHHGVARQHPVLQRFPDPPLHRANELPGNGPAHDLVLEHEA